MFSETVRKRLQDHSVVILLTADQTFLKFLLAKEELLVPGGIKRVGTNVKGDDERKGVTLMIAAYIWRNKTNGVIKAGLILPFIVFNGKIGNTLNKRYQNWSQRPGHFGSINFQK